MSTESEKLETRTQVVRKVGHAVAILVAVREEGHYRTMPARYCTMIDTELRHLDVLEGRLRKWAITEQEQAAAKREGGDAEEAENGNGAR